MKALHIGAGNIGRGFIGAVLNDNGVGVTFADVDPVVVDALKRHHRYVINVVSETGDSEITVDGVDAVHSLDDKDVFDELVAQVDVITTAVGPSLLPVVAESLRQGLEKRLGQEDPGMLNIVAAENVIGGSSILRKEILKVLASDSLDILEARVGFPDSAVDRIVPGRRHDDPLTVDVEPFFEWVIDESSWKGPVPSWEGVTFVRDLEPFIERKLFTVNTGHAAVAYLGAKKGYATIAEAIDDADIYRMVQQVLQETGKYLVDTYGLEAADQEKYAAKTLRRFGNPRIVDEVSRVGRTPIRKLGESERFVKPLKALLAKDDGTAALERVVAAALHFDEPGDEQAMRLQECLREFGVKETLMRYSNLGGTDVEAASVERIANYYRQWANHRIFA